MKATNGVGRIGVGVLGVGALMGLSACGGGSADPSEYPSDNVTVIVPYDAGGNVDTVARPLAHCLEEEWDTRVLVENRPGSTGTVGTRELANAEPDGYTLSVNSVSPYVLGPRLIDNAGYSSDDLQSFGYASAAPIVFFVDADSDLDTLDDLIDAGQLTASAPGADSLQALIAEELNRSEGAELSIVPNDSNTEIVRGVTAGDYEVGITGVSMDVVERVNAGDLKVIVRGGDESYGFFEGVPVFDEAGYGDLLPADEITLPLIGPAGIPDEVGEVIETSLENCLAQENVIEEIGTERAVTEFVSGEESEAVYSELGDAMDAID